MRNPRWISPARAPCLESDAFYGEGLSAKRCLKIAASAKNAVNKNRSNSFCVRYCCCGAEQTLDMLFIAYSSRKA
jgi:hypothetical protein